MGSIKRWMYRGNRPHFFARLLNAGWRAFHSSGILSDWVTLEVIGRKSGRIISFPIVLVPMNGHRYAVSMLGDDAQWVSNVRAAGGKAYIRSRRRNEVRLEEVPVEQRAPILKAYLQRAPGARPHMPVSKDAPVEEFETIANQFPAFRIVTP